MRGGGWISHSWMDGSAIILGVVSGTEMAPAYVEILDQPVDKFRFRYKSEMMGTHGCLSSASTTSRRKRQAPTARVRVNL